MIFLCGFSNSLVRIWLGVDLANQNIDIDTEKGLKLPDAILVKFNK